VPGELYFGGSGEFLEPRYCSRCRAGTKNLAEPAGVRGHCAFEVYVYADVEVFVEVEAEAEVYVKGRLKLPYNEMR